jgi:hypothetical protein
VRLVGHPGNRTVAPRLSALVSGAVAPGLYRWRSRAHPGAVRRELTGVGWGGYALGGQVTDARRFFDGCAEALAFPGWIGHSWEALADGLADLSWLPAHGHVLLWERYGVLAAGDRKAWRRAYETLDGALATRVRYAAAPLYVLLRGTGPPTSPVDGAPIAVLPAVTGNAASRPRRAR